MNGQNHPCMDIPSRGTQPSDCFRNSGTGALPPNGGPYPANAVFARFSPCATRLSITSR